MARMVGKFAVKQGQTEATKVLGKASEQATARAQRARPPGRLQRTGGHATLHRAGRLAGSVRRRRPGDHVDRSTGGRPAPAAAGDARRPPSPPSPGAAHRSDGLAIADYDSLAASQVIPRLPGLSSAELEDGPVLRGRPPRPQDDPQPDCPAAVGRESLMEAAPAGHPR